MFLLHLILRIFFRRVESVGVEGVPKSPAPTIFVLNHPNGLVDSLFVLCLVPRRVSFLAKEPLFRMFFVKNLLAALECLPVYRKQDGADPRQNAATFEAARELLRRGGTIAMFPEGTTHNDSELKPLKTGAARIALGARAGLERLQVVPAGLYFTEKHRFRSDALVIYGEPIEVEVAELDEDGDPPRDAVRALSDRFRESLLAVTLNAREQAGLRFAEAASRVLRAEAGESPGQELAGELSQKRALVEAYERDHEARAESAGSLEERLFDYQKLLTSVRLDPRTLKPRYSVLTVLRYLGETALGLLFLVPLAAIGMLIHFLPYRLIDRIAHKQAADEIDIMATVKILAALLIYPAVWLTGAALITWHFGWTYGAITLVGLPLTGLFALRLREFWADAGAHLRAFGTYMTRPRLTEKLLAERAELAGALSTMLERDTAGATPPESVG
ncbi:MAG: lysophospholipid acyltransferase family protein [Planctomycetota bacterium]|jgi:1-acyl-sn-glycerol-3-phosphate acyltransferase